MSNERCLVGYPFSRAKHVIEKNGFNVFKQFDTEKNIKNAASVMQLNIQIPKTMLFLMMNELVI